MKKYGICIFAILFFFCAILLTCSDNPRDSLFDTNGNEWHPPTVQVMNDTSAAIYDTVTLHAQGYDSNGTISLYEWRGVTDTSIHGDEADTLFKVSFQAAGVERIQVRAKDNDGLYSPWDTMSVTVHFYPPSVRAMADTIAAAKDTIRLHAAGSDINGTIVHYIWALDGLNYYDTTSLGQKKIIFTTTGLKAVPVAAIDDDGLGLAMK
jgi:hypothetical protein